MPRHEKGCVVPQTKPRLNAKRKATSVMPTRTQDSWQRSPTPCTGCGERRLLPAYWVLLGYLLAFGGWSCSGAETGGGNGVQEDSGVDGADAGMDGADASVDGADASVDDADASVDGADASVDDADAGVDGGTVGVRLPDDPAEMIFDQDAFRTYEIILDQDKYDFLNNDPVAEQYVEGEVVFEGETYGPAGVRYKGNVGAWYRVDGAACVGNGTFPAALEGPKTCPKLSLKVSFNEYDREGRFFGLKKLVFHSMNHDTSLMRERLGYGLFREMGVAASRVVHARVLVNGELVGVFALVEYIDGRFTRSRFEHGEGNLYKEVWPGVDDPFRDPGEDAYLDALRTNEDENPSVARILAFNEALTEADESDRLAVLQEWMDLSYMLRYIAADRAILNDDGIFHFYPRGPGGTWAPHNFYWYEDPTRDRLWLIPWDLDISLRPGHPVTHLDTAWNDLEAECEPIRSGTTLFPQLPPACHPIVRGFADPSLRDEYQGVVAELLDEHFSEEVVDAKIEKWSRQIRDAVIEASEAFEDEITVSDWETGIRTLRSAISESRNALRDEIGR